MQNAIETPPILPYPRRSLETTETQLFIGLSSTSTCEPSRRSLEPPFDMLRGMMLALFVASDAFQEKDSRHQLIRALSPAAQEAVVDKLMRQHNDVHEEVRDGAKRLEELFDDDDDEDDEFTETPGVCDWANPKFANIPEGICLVILSHSNPIVVSSRARNSQADECHTQTIGL